MEHFEDYLLTIEEGEKRQRMAALFAHIKETFPTLKEEIKWNQPMYTDHGTFIIGFSVSKGHLSVAPEKPALKEFQEAIEKEGYKLLKEIFHIPWQKDLSYELLEEIIRWNRQEKKDHKGFWRTDTQ